MVDYLLSEPSEKAKVKKPRHILPVNKYPVAFDKEEWKEFTLIEIEEISHDVRRYRFALQSDKHQIGLPIGQHISLKFVDKENKDIIRSYTPISSNFDVGFIDFVIKLYRARPPSFEGGKMSVHLDTIKVGNTMSMRGPKGNVTYHGLGYLSIAKKRDDIRQYKKKKIGMIAGGSGITPMLQIIRAIVKDPEDKTELWLIFANQTEEDILLRKELEALPTDRFHLWYTLDRPPPANLWKYSSGFINEQICRDHLPPASSDSLILVCGPPPMVRYKI